MLAEDGVCETGVQHSLQVFAPVAVGGGGVRGFLEADTSDEHGADLPPCSSLTQGGHESR